MVHDAVKAVNTTSHFWPNYHCCASCDVLDGYSHQDVAWEFFVSLDADLPVEREDVLWRSCSTEDVVWILIVVLCNVEMEFVRKVGSHPWYFSVKMGMEVHEIWSLKMCSSLPSEHKLREILPELLPVQVTSYILRDGEFLQNSKLGNHFISLFPR